MNKWAIISLLATAIIIAILTAIYGRIEIKGVVNVPQVELRPPRIKVNVEINKSKGSILYENIAILIINNERAKIVFKVVGASHSGDFSAIINGKVILRGARTVEIQMPCLASFGNATCYRAMVLIPGYDAPVEIEKGEYRVDLLISWNRAVGNGDFLIEIGIQSE